MLKELTDSQFYIWRTIFALVHADGVVTNEEIKFMTDILDDLPFTQAQRDILKDDIAIPQDPAKMFASITAPRDQAIFFQFARQLVWIDGDYGNEEQAVMLKLKEHHIKQTDLQYLLDSDTGLELEGAQAGKYRSLRKPLPEDQPCDLKSLLRSFKTRFLMQDDAP